MYASFNRAVVAALISFALAGAAEAEPISGQGTWEFTLKGRDLTGDSSADAVYDTVLDVTWLIDANYTNMKWGWNGANGWALGLDINGVDDWRLPTLSGGNELDHLFKTTLGNQYAEGDPLNTGWFINVQGDWYWTETVKNPTLEWYYTFAPGTGNTA